MANPYGYSPDEMRHVGDKLIGVNGQIGEQIREAITAVSGLIGSGFTSGVASGAYDAQFQELQRSLTTVNDQLTPLGEFLKTYANSVETMDQEFGANLRG